MRCSLKHQEHGFTLIELLIVMAISFIVLGAVFSTLVVQRRAFAVQEQITEMVQTARATIDMMSREIRMAGHDPTGAGFHGIPYNAAQLQIRTDLRGDGANDPCDGDTNDRNENITYKYYDETIQIKRKTGSGRFQPFAENVQAFSFAYLDSNGSPTTTTADIRQVRLTITARAAKRDPGYAANGGYRTYTLTTSITPNNLAI